MLSILQRWHERDDEKGFTLIELMVVVLIIAILLAIAIPTFLGARNSANARAAQSDLRNALTAEQTYYSNNQQFTATASDISSIEPNLNWATAVNTSGDKPNTVGMGIATNSTTDDTLFVVAYGADGHCYAIEQVNQPTSTIASGTYYAEFNPASNACAIPSAAVAPTAPAAGVADKASANIGGGYFHSW